MHRDVKPLNILCDYKKKIVKLGDWGLAEFYHPLRKYSYHVGTLYYKGPELSLGYQFYDYSVDMWAVGVILIEALTCKFHVFEETKHGVFDSIANVFGEKDIIDWCQKYNVKITKNRLKRIKNLKKKSFESLFPKDRKDFMEPNAIDLVSKLLVIDHKKRLSAEEALHHPFFNSLRMNEP